MGVTDFKLFAELTYQSSTSSLAFLTATDTQRKKFLINLLNLDKYIKIHEIFKESSKELSLELAKLETTASNINSWIEEHADFDFSEHDVREVPEIDTEITDRIGVIKEELANIESINRRIENNNQYKRLRDNIDYVQIQHVTDLG